MLIIWGTKVKPRPRGIVADQCPTCMEVRRFTVTDHYEVSHVYYLELGEGQRVASSRRCAHCSNDFACVPTNYAAFVADEAAEKLSLEALIQQTNPSLAAVRAARQRIEAIADERPAEPADSTAVTLPGTPVREAPTFVQDAELREALGRLQPYEGRLPKVALLLQRLQGWRRLDNAGRAALLQEVHAVVDHELAADRAAAFLDTMVRRFPQHAGLFAAAIVLVILGVGGVFGYWYWRPCFTLGYAGLALASVFGVYLYLNTAARDRWVRDSLIPRAQREGVDLKKLAALMTTIAQLPEEQVGARLHQAALEYQRLERHAAAPGKQDAKAATASSSH